MTFSMIAENRILICYPEPSWRTAMSRKNVFLSYSHKDKTWPEKIRTQLSVLEKAGKLTLWSDSKIRAGADWEQKIHEAMLTARVAVLVVTANYLTSEFVLEKEIPVLLKKHAQDGMTIFSLIARACAWQDVDWIAKLQVRPENGRPLASLPSARAEESLAHATREVLAMLNEKPDETAG